MAEDDAPGGVSTANLFGLPHAEVLRDSVAEVWESDIDPYVDHESDPEWQVEEWTARPARDFAPNPRHVAEHVAEMMADDMGADTAEEFDLAASAPVVVGLFAAAIGALADRVAWRQADQLVATHLIELRPDDVPLVDGEPMYVRTVLEES